MMIIVKGYLAMEHNAYLLTFHSTWSYGATLQAYASLEALRSIGCRATILNYINPYERKGNETPLELLKSGFVKSAAISAAKNVFFKRKALHKRAFLDFHKELPRSEGNFGSCEQMNDLEVDALIVGSDQVWNPYITNGIDPAFFLQFGHARRRISMASSLGSHVYSAEERETVSGYLKSFDAVSVREQHAVDQIAPLYEGETFRCLDPTLLLDRSYWRSFSQKPTNFIGNEDYILVFNLARRPPWEESLWKVFSSETGLPLWRVSNNTYKEAVFDKLLLGMTPQEFVWLVDHASYVITDSFHGTAFSVSMGTPFVSLEPVHGNRARIVDLLNLLGLSSRMLCNGASTLPPAILDYALVDAKLSKERNDCMTWIKRALYA